MLFYFKCIFVYIAFIKWHSHFSLHPGVYNHWESLRENKSPVIDINIGVRNMTSLTEHVIYLGAVNFNVESTFLSRYQFVYFFIHSLCSDIQTFYIYPLLNFVRPYHRKSFK